MTRRSISFQPVSVARETKVGDNMKRRILGIICFALLLSLSGLALANGVTLRAYTPFADQDPSAQRYNDLMNEWSSEMGNAVEDYSGIIDETFIENLGAALRDGKADIVILPLSSGIDTSYLVDAATLLAAAPNSGIKVLNGMKDDTGFTLIPVRYNWEGLYVNTELLSQYGMTAPTTFEDLIVDCLQLSQLGVTPIANALCEWSEITLDCAAMMGAPENSFGSKESLDGAVNVLTSLTLVGAFGQDPWNASDADMEAKFLNGEAAMRFDTADLASQISEEKANAYTVVPLPGMDGATRQVLVGFPDCGLAMTKACYEDATRREAALSFIEKLLGGGLAAVGAGTLGDSIDQMSRNATNIAGVLYDFNKDTFDEWSEQVIAQLMSSTSAVQ